MEEFYFLGELQYHFKKHWHKLLISAKPCDIYIDIYSRMKQYASLRLLSSVSDDTTVSIFKKQHLMDLTDYKTELAR